MENRISNGGKQGWLKRNKKLEIKEKKKDSKWK